ncbi:hypothetical protein EV586_103570 [Tumebacillus sp. BK434]|uniref:hypothetical protein n=1 Tax=Tumebacillus sp. BK434 TaxID=2512169 RepID=UPI00104839A8|nr:hypothetical protein [Tumebacillus sp. BK434]TCP55911.1 hypothetical protein EV586_103570 [Tumebacillus sp. BK434]
MKKAILLTSLLWVLILAIYGVFGPANLLRELNPNDVLNDQILAREFEGLEIEKVDYLGDRSYLIHTSTKNFVAVQEYTSIMNYHWEIFESKGKFVQ